LHIIKSSFTYTSSTLSQPIIKLSINSSHQFKSTQFNSIITRMHGLQRNKKAKAVSAIKINCILIHKKTVHTIWTCITISNWLSQGKWIEVLIPLHVSIHFYCQFFFICQGSYNKKMYIMLNWIKEWSCLREVSFFCWCCEFGMRDVWCMEVNGICWSVSRLTLLFFSIMCHIFYSK
jgi:hypothetical protein